MHTDYFARKNRGAGVLTRSNLASPDGLKSLRARKRLVALLRLGTAALRKLVAA
jgi:hypothetical protein